MARKLFVFIFLVILWVVLYLITSGGPTVYLFLPASPSQNPLPQPWINSQAQVLLSSFEALSASETMVLAGDCPNEYSVQSGDTLSKIAARCGVQITDLQALNPSLANPNRIYPGQQLIIYSSPLQSDKIWNGKSVSNASLVSAAPGATLFLEASGLPAGASTRVGIGLSGSGYKTLTQASVNEKGILALEVTIPSDAIYGDHAFIMVTTIEKPAFQAMSETFVIGP